MRLILHAAGTGIFLAYVERFDVVPQGTAAARTAQPDPASGLYVVKRAVRPDKTRRGSIIPLSRLRAPVQLAAKFGAAADSRLTKQTVLEYSTEFWLNKYADKETFWALHSG